MFIWRTVWLTDIESCSFQTQIPFWIPCLICESSWFWDSCQESNISNFLHSCRLCACWDLFINRQFKGYRWEQLIKWKIILERDLIQLHLVTLATVLDLRHKLIHSSFYIPLTVSKATLELCVCLCIEVQLIALLLLRFWLPFFIILYSKFSHPL